MINLKATRSKTFKFVHISKFSRKFAEDYVKGRASRVSADSRGSSDRTQSRVSFADHLPQRSRNRSQERDKKICRTNNVSEILAVSDMRIVHDVVRFLSLQ